MPMLAGNIDGDLQFYRVDRKVNGTVVDGKCNDAAAMIKPIAA